MSSRTRVLVMSISAPVIAFAIVGGFLGRVMAREDTYQHLKIFDDVVSLISSNYVDDADIDKVMRGALHGAAGSKVSVTIIRGNANYPHVVELTRATEPASVVNGRMTGTGIGYG